MTDFKAHFKAEKRLFEEAKQIVTTCRELTEKHGEYFGAPMVSAVIAAALSSAQARGVERAVDVVKLHRGSIREGDTAAAVTLGILEALDPSPATPPAEPDHEPSDADIEHVADALKAGGLNEDWDVRCALARAAILAWNTRAPVKAEPEFASPEPHHIQWANAGTAYLKDGPTIPEPVRKDAEPGAAPLDDEAQRLATLLADDGHVRGHAQCIIYVANVMRNFALSSRREALEMAIAELREHLRVARRDGSTFMGGSTQRSDALSREAAILSCIAAIRSLSKESPNG